MSEWGNPLSFRKHLPPLSQSLVNGLVSDLAGKVSNATFAEANQQRINTDALLETSIANLNTSLAGKQNTVVDDALEIRHVGLLQGSLDAKQSLLSDVPGTGISLRYGTKLRQVYGHGGIAGTLSLNQQDINDPSNFQVRISAAEFAS